MRYVGLQFHLSIRKASTPIKHEHNIPRWLLLCDDSLLLLHDSHSKGPNNDAENPPEYYPPTAESQLIRLQELHSICDKPQGEYQPTICKAGSYCPLVGWGRSQIPCPSGHFCRQGSVEPTPCIPLSVCPKESAQQIPTLGFLCIFLLDILLNVIVTGLLNRCFSAIRTRLFQLLLRYFEEKEEAEIGLQSCSRPCGPNRSEDHFSRNFPPFAPQVHILS